MNNSNGGIETVYLSERLYRKYAKALFHFAFAYLNYVFNNNKESVVSFFNFCLYCTLNNAISCSCNNDTHQWTDDVKETIRQISHCRYI